MRPWGRGSGRFRSLCPKPMTFHFLSLAGSNRAAAWRQPPGCGLSGGEPMAVQPTPPADDMIAVASAPAGELTGPRAAVPMLRAGTPGEAPTKLWHARLPGRRPRIVRGPGVTLHAQVEDWL